MPNLNDKVHLTPTILYSKTVTYYLLLSPEYFDKYY